MRIKNLLLLCCSLVCIFITGCSDEKYQITTNGNVSDKVIEKINLYLRNNYIKKSAVVIGTNVNHTEGFYFYGSVSDKSNEAPNKETLFDIGSIAKTFTATLLQDYVDKGYLKIDDPVNKYISAVNKLPGFHGIEISLRNILTQSSGLPLWHTDLSKVPGYDDSNPIANFQIEDIYSRIRNLKLAAIPGDNYEYSNVGFAVLTDLLTTVSGKTYKDLLNECLFKKLNMNHTVIELDERSKSKLAQGHSNMEKAVRTWDISAYLGAGGIYSDIDDMMKWLDANLEPERTQISAVLGSTHELLNDYSKKYEFSMGSAWYIEKLNGTNVYFHGGFSSGYRSFMAFSTEKKVGVVILTAIASDSYDAIKKLGYEILQMIGV